SGARGRRHADTPFCVTFPPGGKTLYAGGQDGAVRAWDVATGEPVAAFRIPDVQVLALQLTQGGTRLAATYSDSRIRFLDVVTLAELSALEGAWVVESAVSSDGRLAATIGPGGAVVTEVMSGLPKLGLTEDQLCHCTPDRQQP